MAKLSDVCGGRPGVCEWVWDEKRLESILIAFAVYRAISEELNVKPCAPIVAKGKAEKLIAWRLV